MKKLMTMIGVAAMAFGLYADFKYNQTDFSTAQVGPLDINKNDAGNDDPPLYWSGEAGDSEIKQGDSAKFLAVDNSEPLYRTVNDKAAGKDTPGVADPQEIGTGVFADMYVKFTAGDAEEEIVVADGAKLGLCVVADEEGNTNLIVKAAALASGDVEPDAANFTIAVGDDFDFDATHRVTIRAIEEISGKGSQIAGFLIYLDGVDGSVPVAAADGLDYEAKMGEYEFSSVAQPFAAAKQLFPSLVGSGKLLSQKIYGIGFKGSGELASVALTDADNAPSFAKPAVDVTVAWVDGVTSYTYNIGEGEVTKPVSGAGSATITLPNAATLVTIDFTVGDAFVKGEIGHTDMEPTDQGWKYTGSNAALTLNSAPVAYTIGTEKYATFEDALAAAIEAGEPTTITLAGSNVAWAKEVKVETGVEITLDLAGNTISLAADYTDTDLIFVDGGKVTLIDSVGGGKIVAKGMTEGVLFVNSGDAFIGLATENDKGATLDAIVGETCLLVKGFFDKVNNDDPEALTDRLADPDNYEIVEDETQTYWTVAERQAEEPVYCYAEVWLNGVKTEQKAAPGDGDHKYAPGTQVTVENAAFFENELFGNGIIYISKMTDADGKEATFSFDGTTFAKVSGDLDVTYDSGKLSMTVTTKGAVAPATEEVLGKIELTTFKQKCYAEVVFDSKVVGTAQPGDDHMYAKGDVAQIVNLGVITSEQVAGLDLPEGTYYVKEATDGEKSWTFSYDGTTFAKEFGDDSIAVSGNVITMSLTVGTSAKLGTITLAKYEKQGGDIPTDPEKDITDDTKPEDIGLDPAGPFKDAEKAELIQISKWANKANLKAAAINETVLFDADGNPTTDNAEAYLLNCDPADTAAVKAAKDAFQVTSITQDDAGNWIVKVTGDKGDTDAYLNGHVDIVDVTEMLDAEAKEASDAKGFFQAKLVK